MCCKGKSTVINLLKQKKMEKVEQNDVIKHYADDIHREERM